MFEELIQETATRFNVSAGNISWLLRGLLGFLTGELTGGVEGFVNRFRRAGLGKVIASWYGGNEGRSLTPVDLEAAIGPAALDRLAGASGLSRPLAASVLTYLVPRVIGRLTPGGRLPSTAALLEQVGPYLDRPAAPRTVTAPPPIAGTERIRDQRAWPAWLPWAAVAALALAGLLWLSSPRGSIDPELTVLNRDGRITCSGVVHDFETHAAIVDTLESMFGRRNIQGDLRVDRRARRSAWGPRVRQLLPMLKTPGVELSMTGDAINVGGWLPDAERHALADRVRSIMGGGASIAMSRDIASETIRAANDKAVAALRAVGTTGASSPDEIVRAMNMAIINFPSGSAVIPSDGLELISLSAAAVKYAPEGSTIEIPGHTDDTGDPKANLALSQARADAVKDAFVAAGIPEASLTARGYGDSRPRARNDTEFGRFQNRRIEYVIKTPERALAAQ